MYLDIFSDRFNYWSTPTYKEDDTQWSFAFEAPGSKKDAFVIKLTGKDISVKWDGSEYSKGYSDHCTHARKRKRIEKKRTSTMFKRFLDWLSDMTHNTEN